VPCPKCRVEFEIPKKGLAGLTVRTHANEPVPSVLCGACFTDERSLPATVYCEDCSSQQQCANCGILLELATTEVGEKRYCEEHKDKLKNMHCVDCGINVCVICCHKVHGTHNFDLIENAIGPCSRSIDAEIEQVTSRIEGFRGVAAQLEAENNNMLDNIKAVELEVKKQTKEMKQLVDRQESELLHKLQSLKSAAEKEVKSHKDTSQLAVSKMESFRTSSLELMSKGSPSDITQAANNVHERAKELLQTYVIPTEYHAPSYKFTPVNIHRILELPYTFERNFIGQVVEVEESGNFKS